jgi:hypothetical protein
MGRLPLQFPVFLLLVTVAIAQDGQLGRKNMPKPKLPVVEATSCLVNGRTNWPIRAGSPMYSTWESRRTRTGVLRAKDRVTILGGLTITREPGKVLVSRSIPGTDLKAGDIIFVYQYMAEGFANTWANGVWCDGCSIADAIMCRKLETCDSKLTEDGIFEDWVQVQTGAGLTGWVLVFKNTGGVIYRNDVFGQLCAG